MSERRIMVLSGSCPGSGTVGEILLRDLCLHSPEKAILCFVAHERGHTHTMPPALAGVQTFNAERRYEHAYRPFGGVLGRCLNGAVSALANAVLFGSHARKLAAQAVQFGRQHRVDTVWAILEAPTTIYVAKRVSQALSARLITTVWDAPQWLAHVHSMDSVSARHLMGHFGDCLRHSERCAVVSDAMKDEYARQYGTQCVILLHAFPDDLRRPPARSPNEPGRLVVGFAGGAYADDSMQAFIGALNNAGWRVAGRNITLRIFGPTFRCASKAKSNIEYLGWLPPEQVINELSGVDVTYLPYPFGTPRELSAFSFPSKLVLYAMSGRPVFLHSPPDTPVVRFFKSYPMGCVCNTLAQSDVLRALEQSVSDLYAGHTAAGQVALDRELGMSVFKSRLATFLGVSESEIR